MVTVLGAVAELERSLKTLDLAERGIRIPGTMYCLLGIERLAHTPSESSGR